jgi:hypothetical protein
MNYHPNSIQELEASLEHCINAIASIVITPDEPVLSKLCALDKAISCYTKLLTAKQKNDEIEHAKAAHAEQKKTTLAAIPFDEAIILRFIEKRRANNNQDISKK